MQVSQGGEETLKKSGEMRQGGTGNQYSMCPHASYQRGQWGFSPTGSSGASLKFMPHSLPSISTSGQGSWSIYPPLDQSLDEAAGLVLGCLSFWPGSGDREGSQ